MQEILQAMDERCQKTAVVKLGDLFDYIPSEVFSILVFLPSVVSLFPVSLIPGVSNLCALVVLFATVHIFLGRQRLWLPRWLRDMEVDSQKASKALARTYRLYRRLARFSFPRCKVMTCRIAQKITSVAGMALASVTLVLGCIPLIDLILMSPVALFGLGLFMRDGVAVGMGWGVLAASGSVAFILF